jgi:phosphoglycolate phosphatase-like HAD superfamily hydrolase
MSAETSLPRRLPISELGKLSPRLIIFDKGGTLIDFRWMWSTWIRELARRVESATGLPTAGRLFGAMGFDPDSGGIDPAGRLATGTMADLRALTVDLLCQTGLSRQASDAAVETAWFAPDPVEEVRPLADLSELFTDLRARGIKIAVATMDDRAPTETTFAALDIESFVDALVCGDDGLPPKPAPDMVWAVCQATGVEPAQAAVVGDSVTDLEMGRAAGAGLVIGVLSGVAPEEMLAPHADGLLASVADL